MDFPCTQQLVEDQDDDENWSNTNAKKQVGFLVVQEDHSIGISASEHPIYEGENIVGRHSDCDISIPSGAALSKRHACIEAQGKSVYIFDCGSSNKTKLGDLRLKPDVRYCLQNQNCIKFANVRCIFKEVSNTINSMCDSSLNETGQDTAVDFPDNVTSKSTPQSLFAPGLLALDTPDSGLKSNSPLQIDLNDSNKFVPDSQPCCSGNSINSNELGGSITSYSEGTNTKENFVNESTTDCYVVDSDTDVEDMLPCSGDLVSSIKSKRETSELDDGVKPGDDNAMISTQLSNDDIFADSEAHTLDNKDEEKSKLVEEEDIFSDSDATNIDEDEVDDIEEFCTNSPLLQANHRAEDATSTNEAATEFETLADSGKVSEIETCENSRGNSPNLIENDEDSDDDEFSLLPYSEPPNNAMSNINRNNSSKEDIKPLEICANNITELSASEVNVVSSPDNLEASKNNSYIDDLKINEDSSNNNVIVHEDTALKTQDGDDSNLTSTSRKSCPDEGDTIDVADTLSDADETDTQPVDDDDDDYDVDNPLVIDIDAEDKSVKTEQDRPPLKRSSEIPSSFDDISKSNCENQVVRSDLTPFVQLHRLKNTCCDENSTPSDATLQVGTPKNNLPVTESLTEADENVTNTQVMTCTNMQDLNQEKSSNKINDSVPNPMSSTPVDISSLSNPDNDDLAATQAYAISTDNPTHNSVDVSCDDIGVTQGYCGSTENKENVDINGTSMETSEVKPILNYSNDRSKDDDLTIAPTKESPEAEKHVKSKPAQESFHLLNCVTSLSQYNSLLSGLGMPDAADEADLNFTLQQDTVTVDEEAYVAAETQPYCPEQQPSSSTPTSPNKSSSLRLDDNSSFVTQPSVRTRPKRKRKSQVTDVEVQPKQRPQRKRRGRNNNQVECDSLTSQRTLRTRKCKIKSTKINQDDESLCSDEVVENSLNDSQEVISVVAALRPRKTKPKVMFTGVIDKVGETIVKELGGQMTNDMHECTHLVTDKIRRTVKFLCAVVRGIFIVNQEWLRESMHQKRFLLEDDFELNEDNLSQSSIASCSTTSSLEDQYQFKLSEALSTARTRSSRLFSGCCIHVTKSVLPPPDQMYQIIECGGGSCVKKLPRGKKLKDLVVVSTNEDKRACSSALKAGTPIVNKEYVLTGILQQKLDINAFRLFVSDSSTLLTRSSKTPSCSSTPMPTRGRERKKRQCCKEDANEALESNSVERKRRNKR